MTTTQLLLLECCVFSSGGTPAKSKSAFWNGDIPWFSPKDMKSHDLTASQDTITDLAVESSSTKLMPEGTVFVVGRSGVLAHTLPVGVIRQASAFNQDIKAIQANPEILDFEYLAFFLKANEPRILREGVKVGPTVHSLKSGFLESLEIPLPPLAEQKRIAAKLKAQLAEVEKARQALVVQQAEMNELHSIVLEEIYRKSCSECKEVVLPEVAFIEAKLVNPTLEEYKDLPHVSAENIEGVSGELLNVRSAFEDGMTSGKYLFDQGDVLYSKLRPYLRKVALPSFGGLCSADMYPIKVDKSRLLPEFLQIALLSRQFTDYANELSQRSRMPKLNREQLFAWAIPLPPLDVQQQCISKMKAVFIKLATAREALAASRTDVDVLPSKLLAAAFTG